MCKAYSQACTVQAGSVKSGAFRGYVSVEKVGDLSRPVFAVWGGSLPVSAWLASSDMPCS